MDIYIVPRGPISPRNCGWSDACFVVCIWAVFHWHVFVHEHNFKTLDIFFLISMVWKLIRVAVYVTTSNKNNMRSQVFPPRIVIYQMYCKSSLEFLCLLQLLIKTMWGLKCLPKPSDIYSFKHFQAIEKKQVQHDLGYVLANSEIKSVSIWIFKFLELDF